jgi:hypothetical protein
MLSEVSQAQKNKGHLLSLICGRQIQKINIYTKIGMIIPKLICITFAMFSREHGERRKGKENDRTPVML